MNIEITSDERQLLATHLLARGRNPTAFATVLQADGLVRVNGPRGTAFYPRDRWFAAFSRHLDKSFFDPHVPPVAGLRFLGKASLPFSSTA